MKIETLAIHAAADPDPLTGAISPPIYLSTTFEHGPASEELHGYTYVRDRNPTSEDVYVHVRVAYQQYLPKWNVQVSVVDMEDQKAIDHALRPNTKLIWVETPSNPRMQIADIVGAARAAHSVGAFLLVDNTFATPV